MTSLVTGKFRYIVGVIAETITRVAYEVLPNASRGITPSVEGTWTDFAMCRETKMPFVLFEFGFFTNPQELELLKDDEFRKLSAKVVVQSACEYAGREFIEPIKVVEEPVVEVPMWKIQALKELHDAGILNDYEGWKFKIDESAPNWMVFILVNELRKVFENSKTVDDAIEEIAERLKG